MGVTLAERELEPACSRPEREDPGGASLYGQRHACNQCIALLISGCLPILKDQFKTLFLRHFKTNFSRI